MLKVLNRFFALLRTIVGMEEDVDAIVRPITRIVDKLQKHHDAQIVRGDRLEEEAAKMFTDANNSRRAAVKAKTLAEKYSELAA